MQTRLIIVILLVLTTLFRNTVVAAQSDSEPTGKILYICRPAGVTTQSLCVMEVETGEISVIFNVPDEIVHNTQREILNPAWSFSGEQIVFQYWDGLWWHLWVMEADGSDPTQITTTPDVQHWSPSWSPDDEQIVYSHAAEGGIRELWIIGSDGSNPTALTATEEADEYAPDWSPNGDLIVFERSEYAPHLTSTIWIISPDGGEPVPLTTSDTECHSPAFSPDGTAIVVLCRNEDDWYDIWVMAADGTNQRRLLVGEDGIGSPTWSPDGEWLAISQGSKEEAELWIMRPDGSDLRQLTDNTSRDETPSWFIP